MGKGKPKFGWVSKDGPIRRRFLDAVLVVPIKGHSGRGGWDCFRAEKRMSGMLWARRRPCLLRVSLQPVAHSVSCSRVSPPLRAVSAIIAMAKVGVLWMLLRSTP